MITTAVICHGNRAVLAWCANFVVFSQNLRWGADPQGFFLDRFLGLTRGPGSPGGLRWAVVAAAAGLWLATWFVCSREVHRGIERVCKLFVPLLFATVIVLAAWACTLPGAGRGLRYYLAPDWSRLMDYRVWIAAYGQVFFSLSIGFGIMIAYASYLPRRADLVGNALLTCLADTAFALVAGLAVFATLGYLAQAKGQLIEQVVKPGPLLAFVVYPEAISRLPFGRTVFGGLFFLALLLAGFTHGLAIVESAVSAVRDKFKWSRGAVVAGLCLAGCGGSLLFATGAGLYWLDIVDHFLNHYGLVTACLLECVIVGHFLKAAELREHISRHAWVRLNRGWDWMIQYLIPVVLLVTLYRALSEEFVRPYGGYPLTALASLGVAWLLATLVAAFGLAAFPWDPARLRREHAPGSDELFL